jgi:hypothetical protein
MSMSRFATTLCLVLASISLAACSKDDESSEGSGTNARPFAFLGGTWSVDVTPTFSSCPEEGSASQQDWEVSTFGVAANVTTMPAASGADADAGAAEPTLSFSGALDETLHYTAALGHDDVLGAGAGAGGAGGAVGVGCLERNTTVLDVQFIPSDAGPPTLMGTRSEVKEYAGGGDCPAGCRRVFGLTGTPAP